MGNKQSVHPESFGDTTHSSKIKFGSIHDPGCPRPGYYYNQNTRILKYHINNINLLPGENTFKKLKYGYGKTNKRVFYKGIHITNANPNTFTTLTIPEIRNIINIVPKYDTTELIKLNSVLGIETGSNGVINKVYYKGKLV